jgi:hypothetical protein
MRSYQKERTMAKTIHSIANIDEHLNQTNRRGERTVYNTLSKKLGHDWTVFYNVEWLGQSHEAGVLRDGEADFLVCHPNYGAFFIEVKGGVEILAEEGSWFTVTRYGNKKPIKDPFKQAKDSKYNIATRFSEENGDLDTKQMSLFHLVILPEVEELHGTLPLTANESILVTTKNLANIENVLLDLYKSVNSAGKRSTLNSALHQQFIDWMIGKIKPTVISTRRIQDYLHDSEQRIVELSEIQIRIIKGLEQNRRVNITGCAGSGKTLIAVHQAKTLATRGNRTLLCCINSVLGTHLEKITSGVQNLTACSFQSVIDQICRDNGFRSADFEKRLDFAYEQALLDRVDKYDAVIVDEEQDFTQKQVELVQLIAKPNAYFYTFNDPSQQILHLEQPYNKNAVQFHLSDNYRNTKEIFDEVFKHYYGQSEMHHIGPSGKEIKKTAKYPFNSTIKLHESVKREVHLLLDQGFKTTDIVILTFKSKDESNLADLRSERCRFDAFNNEYDGNGIRVETVRRYKGMDSPIVILTELDDQKTMENQELWHNMCYVSFSRSRSYLVLIPPSNINI